jgi:tRNA(fMet)-specific endonuclease VapC
MEVIYGFQLNPAAHKKYSRPFQSLCSITRTIACDSAVAETAAQIRAQLKTRGTPIGPWDLLIGASALVHNCVLVTSNQREFQRIDGLLLENWR